MEKDKKYRTDNAKALEVVVSLKFDFRLSEGPSHTPAPPWNAL